MKERNTKLFAAIGGAIALFIIIIVIIISVVSKKSSNATSASVDTTKTSTPFDNIGSNTANSLTHKQNKLELEQKKADADKQKLQEQVEDLQNQINKKSSTEKSDYEKKLQKQIAALKDSITSIQVSSTSTSDDIPVGNGNSKPTTLSDAPIVGGYRIIDDETTVTSEDGVAGGFGLGKKNLFGTNKQKDAALNKNDDEDEEPIPAYTMPDGTMLTDVVATTNLIGRIPKGDEHQVIAPYEVHFHIDKDNLTSKNFKLSDEMKDITGRAICVGDFMASSNACKVIAITYIFPDGTISTVKAKDISSESRGLGYLADQYGRPQIKGVLSTGVGIRMGGAALMGGTSAIGSAIQQAGTSVAGGGDVPFYSNVTNTGQYAAGQGLNSGAIAAQKEWSETSKNMFDYVVSDNWDEETHEMRKFNIILTEEIHFDYDKKGRMIDHHFVMAGNKNSTDLF